METLQGTDSLAAYDGPLHAHILFHYLDCRGIFVHQLQKFLRDKQFPCFVSVCYDPEDPRANKTGLSMLLHYLMQPKELSKESGLDLCPSKTDFFRIPSKMEASQYKKLCTLTTKPSEQQEAIEYLVKQECEVPDTPEQFYRSIKKKVERHQELRSESMRKWKLSYWSYLPLYRLVNYAAKLTINEKSFLRKVHCKCHLQNTRLKVKSFWVKSFWLMIKFSPIRVRI